MSGTWHGEVAHGDVTECFAAIGRTRTHLWAVCDVCGEGMWLAADRLTVSTTKTDPEPGLKCRMTPGCRGKHRYPARGTKR